MIFLSVFMTEFSVLYKFHMDDSFRVPRTDVLNSCSASHMFWIMYSQQTLSRAFAM